MNKTYYVGQTPVEQIVFTVRDERRSPRSLSAYSAAEVIFRDPTGQTIEGGSASITDAANGEVTYQFPETSLFTMAGAHSVQLKMINGDRADYADIATIKVRESLEG